MLQPGTAHRDPYLPGAGEVRGTFDPDTDFIEGYAEAWAHHMREGSVNDQDEMPLTQILVIANATGGESYTSRLPPAAPEALPAAGRRLRPPARLQAELRLTAQLVVAPTVAKQVPWSVAV